MPTTMRYHVTWVRFKITAKACRLLGATTLFPDSQGSYVCVPCKTRAADEQPRKFEIGCTTVIAEQLRTVVLGILKTRRERGMSTRDMDLLISTDMRLRLALMRAREAAIDASARAMRGKEGSHA